jgi:hypothetical protein
MAMEREAWKRDAEQAKTHKELLRQEENRKIRRIFSVRNES